MAEYLAPGVFIEEIPRGPRPIEGVPTSTAAFLGETERGPTRPRLITSLDDYRRHFGADFADGRYLPDAIHGYFANGGQRAYVCRVVGPGAQTAARTAGGLRIDAIGPGAWGDRLCVKITGSSMTKEDGSPIGFRLQVAYWQMPSPDGLYSDPFDRSQPSRPSLPTLVEDFDNLRWDNPASSDYFEKRLQARSTLVVVSAPQPLVAQPAADFANLAGGADAMTAPGVTDFAGENADSTLRTGLSALDLGDCREVALVYAPAAPPEVVGAVVSHCERNQFRFAVIDPPGNMPDPNAIDPRLTWDTQHAAYHYPWVWVSDLQSGQRKLVPPGGHVLGVYARSDAERGVWKAPANETLRDVSDLALLVDNHMADVLNSRGVNAIRRFPGRGIRVWGARTLSSDLQWRYVNVRRFFIFLERSIYEGTQWVVFEPNDERLWEQVKETIRAFLHNQWRSGALMGQTEEQAFFIACDRSTMTSEDILNGRLICEIGIAALRPAEFAIFRIQQQTASGQS